MLKSILLTGVGGQGVVTMANLMTAHFQKLGMRVTLIHATGMAQRGGRVTSEVRYSSDPDSGFGPRISSGGADYIIGMDMAETINSVAFMKTGGCLVFNDYTLIPSEAVLKKERFPDAQEVENLFTGLGCRTIRVQEPPRPANLFVLGVFSAVCPDLEGLGDTLKTALTRRVEENLEAFRKGQAFGVSL